MSDKPADTDPPRRQSGADINPHSTTPSDSASVSLHPYADNLFAQLTSQLLTQHLKDTEADLAPRQRGDLTHCIVLLPTLNAIAPLRRQLLKQANALGIPALLGPTINTLRGWVEATTPASSERLSAQGCELMLVEALEKFPNLFGSSSPWSLSESLIKLFDELTVHHITLPDDVDSFIKQLEQAYSSDHHSDNNPVTEISALSREAYLVHTLWQAWHHQQREESVIDPQSDYIERLATNLAGITEQAQLYVAGYYQLIPAEKQWLNALIERGQLQLVLQGNNDNDVAADDYHPDAVIHSLLNGLPAVGQAEARQSNYSALLDQVYPPLAKNQQSCQTAPLAERAKTFAKQHPTSPCNESIHCYQASSAEQEAVAVVTRLREWLHSGKKRIAVVTEDRRLARRLRALLERESITLKDHSGWALSTTRAAATMERWLEAVEEDYDQQPLLDTLKSPFVFSAQPRETFNKTLYRFEQDIVLHENIARGMSRYRNAIEVRQRRLPWSHVDTASVHALLNSLEAAAAPLLSFIDNQSHSPTAMLDALQESLSSIGIWQAYRNDLAGDAIITEINAMRHAIKGRSLKINWSEFRTWLGRALERANFAAQENGQIQLLTLEQSNLQQFDAIVIAGITQEHFPGQKESSPFFNDSVRHALGIPPASQGLATRFYHFRRLLEAAPNFLLTCYSDEGGAASTPSPWLELLQRFHQLAYGEKLHDGGLAQRLAAYKQQQAAQPIDGLNAAPAPAPIVPRALIPKNISASSYQKLIDCPYQFYVSYCLNLRAADEIREALQKSDYGEHVHHILQRFHDPQGKEAFQLPVDNDHRDAAIEHLNAISQRIFKQDLEDNYLHRGWLQQWLAIVPHYIDWQIERAQTWQVSAVEQSAKLETLDPLFDIKGRLDRVDHSAEGTSVVDYKTGIPARLSDIEAGEAVQLPFYALLSDPAPHRVEYLALAKEKVKTAGVLEGEHLASLAEQNRVRLKQLMAEIHDGKPMPAWGDETTCGYCDMQGLCRKQAWTGEYKSK
ncbi:MAG: PD-(D/E)XK nuclease family protein [Thiotrichaceae bacterium]|nr:PD-(D/E)XK nuclease family protein [Thiotrichaceae bacterium]